MRLLCLLCLTGLFIIEIGCATSSWPMRPAEAEEVSTSAAATTPSEENSKERDSRPYRFPEWVMDPRSREVERSLGYE
jgi:hypothetical protein